MKIQDKVLKIEEFVDKYIEHDEVLNGIERILKQKEKIPYKEYKIVDYYNEDMKLSIDLIRLDYDRDDGSEIKFIYSNNFNTLKSMSLMVCVPSSEINQALKFQMKVDKVQEFVDDTISTETSIQELEEMVFNFTLQYGTSIDLSKLLVIYVLYKKYLKSVPYNYELFFEVQSTSNDVCDIIGI